MYGTGRWQKRRRYQLQLQPLCEMCLRDGRIVPATVVDHVEPHKDDERKFGLVSWHRSVSTATTAARSTLSSAATTMG